MPGELAYYPKVLIFDETPKQSYSDKMRLGVNMADGSAVNFFSPEASLDRFDESVDAFVTTLFPDQPGDESLLDAPALPLVIRAHELGTPVAFISRHARVSALARLDNQDIVLSNGNTIRLAHQTISKWLINLSGSVFGEYEAAPKEEVRDLTLKEQVELCLLGSTRKLDLGLWILGSTGGEDFNAEQACQAIGSARYYTADLLRTFYNLGMLESVTVATRRRHFYRIKESPLWQIFEATANALEESQVQDDPNAAE
jgi:hypothetical protein